MTFLLKSGTIQEKGGMKMRFAVDRIEGDFAVCIDDDHGQHDIRLCEIPFSVAERDVLIGEITPDGVKITEKDDGERDRRLESVRALRKRLMNR